MTKIFLQIKLNEILICFLVSALAKNAEIIKFLGILKNRSLRLKYIFVQERKAIFCIINVIFVFHTIFKLDFITQIIYCIIHRRLCSHFILFCSLISVSKKWNIETMLTFPYSYNWKNFNNKMNEKRSQKYHSMDAEYITGQINSHILKLLLRRFCCLIFAPSQNSSYALVQ